MTRPSVTPTTTRPPATADEITPSPQHEQGDHWVRYSHLSESALQRLMEQLAPALRSGGVVYLRGDLGAGKTTVARTLIQALGYPGRVKSPTYALIEEYDLSGLRICHLDLYRLADGREVLDLGLEDMGVGEACLVLIEWPEKGHGNIPAADLEITLTVQGEQRVLHMQAASELGQGMLAG